MPVWTVPPPGKYLALTQEDRQNREQRLTTINSFGTGRDSIFLKIYDTRLARVQQSPLSMIRGMNSLRPASPSRVNWKRCSIYYKIARHQAPMKKVLPFLPAALYYCLIFFVSSQSHPLRVPVANFDKLAHGAAFSVMGFLLAFGFFKGLHASLKIKILSVWLLGTGLGILDEIHQVFVRGRTSDPLDAIADGIGVGLGILLYWLVVREKISSRSR